MKVFREALTDPVCSHKLDAMKRGGPPKASHIRIHGHSNFVQDPVNAHNTGFDMPTDRITTERLVLRPPVSTDASFIAALMSPDVSRWLASWPSTMDVHGASRRIADANAEIDAARALHWLIEQRGSGDVLGWIRITRDPANPTLGDLGFWLGRTFQGFGFATEAVRAAVAAGFARLGLLTIEGGAQLANEASQRVMQRIGMRRADVREVWTPTRQRYEACIYYVLEHDGLP